MASFDEINQLTDNSASAAGGGAGGAASTEIAPDFSNLDMAEEKLTSSIKNTYKIEMLEDGGYSRDGEWEADMRGTYGRGSSYRGRHRDSMGRYSRTDAREHMRSTLEDMMRDADDDKTREAIRRCMEQIDRA